MFMNTIKLPVITPFYAPSMIRYGERALDLSLLIFINNSTITIYINRKENCGFK